MSVKQQYIDLYTQAAAAIKQKSMQLLNEGRDEAFECFSKAGFPTSKCEEYRNISVDKLFATDFGININRLHVPIDTDDLLKCDVPGIHAHLFFIVNDQLVAAPNTTLPEGVTVCSMIEAEQQYADLIKQHLNSAIDNRGDELTAFNRTFAQDGYFVYIKRGVELEKPIQIINVMKSKVDTMATTRNLVLLEPCSSAKMLLCDHTMDNKAFLASRLTEVVVADGAHFDYYTLENTHDKMANLTQLFVTQARDSNVTLNGITLHNGNSHHRTDINLNGSGAYAWVGGLCIASKEQHIENHLAVTHSAANATSHQLFKYVIDDASVGVFSGKIKVAEGAQQTQAFQTNRNLSLSNDAKMHTKPQLEIYADDVKCGHGATTGQLDDSALFYMQARGIGAKEARMLLMFAFAADVLEQMQLEALRDRLKIMVEKRFRGDLSKCNGCVICN